MMSIHCLQASILPNVSVKAWISLNIGTRPAVPKHLSSSSWSLLDKNKLTAGQATELQVHLPVGHNMATEASKKEAFRQYLEQAGVLDTMTKSGCCLCLAELSA